jgi:hypothetical protein
LLFLATGEKSPFAGLVPKLADDLRVSGFADVKTGTIREVSITCCRISPKRSPSSSSDTRDRPWLYDDGQRTERLRTTV